MYISVAEVSTNDYENFRIFINDYLCQRLSTALFFVST